ncbi:MAG: EAL domain-containing protein [Rhodoferax sp.]|jgi:diguanylate cyclase (GGDEF)-like protein/PAS domain S-box-containing protein|uniref:putative bifunctional diguanylate cyclase/phosphodiesterase n=1 Tax=Rhodoferax sp. TaxID=50421 RepID=UPI001B3D67F5|nr:GGDEF domain-containing response regulator [Rhodoferax sp.]MBP8287393.1 EAL domain-containing protein [Rhodoferax sp.]MBP9148266.1 EAL domain-containing protein [Rhodoferax sp.]MBP9736090.1 EAL domain-containing protein [Rhodoferax sp.]
MSPAAILLVEDETVVAHDIRLQLQDMGYQVAAEARTGEDAIALAEQLHPDLVLMDIQLGSAMDGIAAAQVIRAQQRLPIVFLSAFAADEMLSRAMLVEPYGYILKPFSDRELHTVLQMALYKHQAEERERDLARRNQAILDNMVNGVITVDALGRIESFNRGACAMFGYTAQEVIGCNVAVLMPEPFGSEHALHLSKDQLIGHDRVVCRQREVEGRRHDGSRFPLGLTVSRITLSGKPCYISILTDLSAHRLAEERIHHLAYFDDLTGLPNRRRLLDRLKAALAACARSGQHGALIFLDLDHFRQINETLGPGFGDELLCEVAQRLVRCVGDDDTAAHIGGDEFMVMLESIGVSGQTAAVHAENMANKIQTALTQPYSLRGRGYTSSASMGIVIFNRLDTDTDELLKMADAAMYQAKQAGRCAARFFDPTIQALSVARTKLEKEMRHGLQAEQFLLHYQVQVDVRGHPIGAESLVRWQHPVLGLVPPGQFIALAEETGLILQLGQWVLRTACQQLVAWSAHPGTARWSMAVNVSSLQFAQTDFVETVAQVLEETGADAYQLKLELTESMLVHDVSDVIAKMSSLKALGVSFSLDDFGTGYSSLSYLKRLPMDQLKIDQSFVRDILTDHDDAVIARSIVALGHNLGMSVIAEGVETVGQRDMLAQMGCDAFQGYLFGRPVPVEQIVLQAIYI